ncbi:hypothetical protein TRFO_13517 [Tritrichomonas foetus]|uniref:Uncharacterized protein n=1 Tax=Tritrichomonas foetus TaxID=1144522 RepID=A0A1J4L2A9_9EUKA|nr:hypothetical protein TRFO_13517 [Tritrichomonas foetus]|eukprot:OHT16029.1 hypothetical protein TRFO_13517 [Tritrichomonas foetus]
MKHILDQTKVLKKKTEVCKAALNKDEQMSELAKKFQAMQHFKEKADKSVQELQKIFDDGNISSLKSSLEEISEKIHFLYWNNKELNDQIEILEKMVSTEEAVGFTELKEQWNQLHVDVVEQENKQQNSNKGGASLRVSLRNKNKNNKEMKSDAPIKGKKGQFSSVFGDDEENQQMKSEAQIHKHKIALPDSENYSESSSKRSRRSAFNAVLSKGKKLLPANEETEEDMQSDASRITYKSMAHQSTPTSNNSAEEESRNTSKNSSKLNNIDFSSQLADESESAMTENYVVATEINRTNSNNTNGIKKPDLVSLKHAQSKVSMRSNDSLNYVRKSKPKRSFPPKNLNKESDSEYDYYESEPPPNPKKGTVRVSQKDPEYEYEYYDPEDEEADDEYEFIEEPEEPAKVIVSKAKKVDKSFEPVVVKTFTSDEYRALKVSKPKPIQVNEAEGEKIIKTKAKAKNTEKNEPEIITIKKSAKTIEEDAKRAKEREFVPEIRKPKKSIEEILQKQAEVDKEELIKKYEERSLQRAIEDEEKMAIKKFEDKLQLKDDEEQFVKRSLKYLQKIRMNKRHKLEQIKNDEEIFMKESRKRETQFVQKIIQLKKSKEEEMKKQEEEKKEKLKQEEIKQKILRERIGKRKKEEEERQKHEKIKQMTEKEAEEQKLLKMRQKAKKLKEEERLKQEQREKEAKVIENRNKQRKEAKLKETQLKEKQMKEKELQKQKQEQKEKEEKEKLAKQRIEQRKKEEEARIMKEKELQKQKEEQEKAEIEKKRKIIVEMNEKERRQKEEMEAEKQKLEKIKQEIREKKRKEREQREIERKERERKEQELKELYDGMIDIPVKHSSTYQQQNNLNNTENGINKNESMSNGKYNDNQSSSNFSDDMMTSESMAELDVADPISVGVAKLAALHDDKNKKHSHLNARKVRRRKTVTTNSSHNGDPEYEYDYEYDFDDFIENSKLNGTNSPTSQKSSFNPALNNNSPSSKNESEAERLASQDEKQIQQQLQQMNKEEKQKSNPNESPSRFGSDDDIEEIGRREPTELDFSDSKVSQPNTPKRSSQVNSKFNNDNFNEFKSNSESDISKNKHRTNANLNNSMLESDASDDFAYSDDEFGENLRTSVVTSKLTPTHESSQAALNKLGNDKSSNKINSSIPIETARPLRKKKGSKPEFVPEFYDLKPEPKYVPVVVGRAKNPQKTSTPLIVKKIDGSSNAPKPIVIDSISIPKPETVCLSPDIFTVLKTKEQLEAEAKQEAEREERRRLHAEKEKNYRHTIDANGNEYEYNYDYDYEYDNSDVEKEDTASKMHATHRDSEEFLKELAKEVAQADAVVQESNEILKKRGQSISQNVSPINSPNTKQQKNSTVSGKESLDENCKKTDNEGKKKVKVSKRVKRTQIQQNGEALEDDENHTNKSPNANKNPLKGSKSVTFDVDDDLFDLELSKKLNAKGAKQAPQKRPLQSARRQRNGYDSPVVPTKGGPTVGRISMRRQNRESSDYAGNTDDVDEFFDEEEEEAMLQSMRKEDLLVEAELDSRPVSPRKPKTPKSHSNNGENDEINDQNNDRINNVHVNNGIIILGQEDEEIFDDDYDYEDVYEYEYISDDENNQNNNNTENDSVQNKTKKISEEDLNNSLSDNEDEFNNYDNENGISRKLTKNNKNTESKTRSKRSMKELNDLTENEKAFDNRNNTQLNNLVSKVRADAAVLSNEDLRELLKKLKEEIEVENNHNSKLTTKLKELEKVRDHQIPHHFSHSKIASFGIAPVDNSSNFITKTIQTDVTNEFLTSIETTLAKQNKEKQELIELQKRIEIAQKEVITMDATIKAAEKQTVDKKNAIEALKVEILKVKEELSKSDYDTTQDEQQSKQCEMEIEKLEAQVQQSQQKLDKVNQQIHELQLRLQEMINYKAVLEAELNDMYNREKPEVRQLIEDVKNAKQASEDLQQKTASLTKRINARREEINRIMNSQEKVKADELRLLKEKLTRRISKWEKMIDSKDTAQNIQQFSAKNAIKREALKHEIDNKTRQLWMKSEQINALQKYSELIEAMLNEHKTNWAT